MRTTKRLSLALLGGGLVLALTACGVAQQAADTADQVSKTAGAIGVCTDAVKIATGAPDLTDPKAAADQAHAAADELTGLASRAADAKVGEAIDTLANTLRRTTADDLVSAPADWLKQKTDQVSVLTKACGL